MCHIAFSSYDGYVQILMVLTFELLDVLVIWDMVAREFGQSMMAYRFKKKALIRFHVVTDVFCVNGVFSV